MNIPVYGGKSSSIVNIVLPIRNDVAISSTCDKVCLDFQNWNENYLKQT